MKNTRNSGEVVLAVLSIVLSLLSLVGIFLTQPWSPFCILDPEAKAPWERPATGGETLLDADRAARQVGKRREYPFPRKKGAEFPRRAAP